MRLLSFYIVIFFSLFFFGFTDTNTTQRLDYLLGQCEKDNLFSGSVLYGANDTILYQKAFGFQDFTSEKKLNIDSSFRLASVSKAFTAMSIVMLFEDGKISFNDDIKIYFPKIPYKNVTIQDLIHHMSGIPNYVPLFNKHWSQEEKRKAIAKNSDVLLMLKQYAPKQLFPAGEQFRYSNSGYVLLAMIVENISGISFDVFLKERIFKPLNMDNTYLFNPQKPRRSKNQAYGFANPPDGEKPVRNDAHFLNGIYGDGGIYSTTGDLVKWSEALYSDSLISYQSLNLVFSEGRLNNGSKTGYGFGWKIEKKPLGQKLISHQGKWLGFKSIIKMNIDTKSILIVLANDTNENFFNITSSISAIIEGKEYYLPKPPISRWLGGIINKRGINEAINQYKKQKSHNILNYDFSHLQFEKLGLLYIQKKLFKEAVAILKLNVEENPNNFQAYNALGRASLYSRNVKSAFGYFKKSILLNPEKTNQAHVMLNKIRLNAPADQKHLYE